MEANNSKPEQFRVQLPPAQTKKLRSLASKYGKRSAGTVASEIILAYTPLWEKTQQALREQLEQACSTQ